MLELIWLLLPIAAASGWWLARRASSRVPGNSSGHAEYFKGLNYLLDDKQDQAIAVFTRMVESDHETIETHLTLGSLFRRRGEVDRAIHIHHSLTNRTDVTPQQRDRARFELAEDYMRAGLFDRAETLYRTLIETPYHTATALYRLLEIYEQEKDWQQAITYCDQLERMTGQVRKAEAAHYCCELAEEALNHGHRETAEEYLRQALKRDASCIRASMLNGQIAMNHGELQTAIASFKTVARQDPNYFTEVIDLLAQCYEELGDPGELLDYLSEIQKTDHSGRFTAALAKLLIRVHGKQAAQHFLQEELRRYPTFMGLRHLVELKLNDSDNNDAAASDLDTLYRTSKHMLDDTARYRCDHCGFITRTLNWRCPSCKHWNSTKPLPDLMCNNSF